MQSILTTRARHRYKRTPDFVNSEIAKSLVLNNIAEVRLNHTHAPVPTTTSTFGLGLQYDFTPHLGIYLEPSLQYFVDDGSDIKTYRTEHPFSITLPLGIRFRW